MYLVETIQKGVNELEESVQITSDLNHLNMSPWFKTGISTIPIQCTQTSLIPDAYRQDQQTLTIIELSVPFETNTEKAHNYKESKHAHLINDLESKGCTVKYFAIEIGSPPPKKKKKKKTTELKTYRIC